MNPHPAMTLEFNLFATAFFLVIAIIPKQALHVASFGRAKPLGPREVIGWRIFAGFFALTSAWRVISML